VTSCWISGLPQFSAILSHPHPKGGQSDPAYVPDSEYERAKEALSSDTRTMAVSLFERPVWPDSDE